MRAYSEGEEGAGGHDPRGESALTWCQESFHFYDFIACFIQLAAGRVFVNIFKFLTL